MTLRSDNPIQISQRIASNLYLHWLKELDILELLQSPDTVPAILHKRRLPDQQFPIFESILRFLDNQGYITEAGGTFSLSRPINEIMSLVSLKHLDGIEHKPIFRFISYGLSLIDERLEGGSGVWDLEGYGYIFERGFTSPVIDQLVSDLGNTFNLNKIQSGSEELDITLLALYPDAYLRGLPRLVENYDKFTIITLTEKLRRKAITYCEINKINGLSRNIHALNQYHFEETDLLFVPNGVGFHIPFPKLVKSLYNLLSDTGVLYIYIPVDNMLQIGIEPLLPLNPNFYSLPSLSDIKRLFKSNGFTTPISVGNHNAFLEIEKSR